MRRALCFRVAPAKPADIPVDYSMRVRSVVNLQTVKAVGIRIPEAILLQADEVIR